MNAIDHSIKPFIILFIGCPQYTYIVLYIQFKHTVIRIAFTIHNIIHYDDILVFTGT